MNGYLLKRLILDFIYPNRCPFCDSVIPFDEYYCNECRNRLSDPPFHDDYAGIDFFCAVTEYDDSSIPIVREIKNEGNGYALSAAAFLIFQQLNAAKKLQSADVITYVPMSGRDKRKRGYDQTKIIASELGALSGKPCAGLLKKVRATSEQKTLTAAERRKNMKNAFAYKGRKSLCGKTVLIIDDVCTTGSTLSEAAAALKRAGAGKVNAAVFAKTGKIS